MPKIYSILLLVLLSIPSITFSKTDSSKTVRSYKLTEPLIIDGKLTESVYQNKPIEEFMQKQPDEGKLATEKSKVWIFYDELNLYLSGKFFDSHPDSIDQTLMRRDNLVESDWFWIYLDPYNDDRTGFYFAVNAGGSICDGTLYNDSWSDDSWDGIWETKTNVDSEGWSVEVKIPFAQLRFKESENMIWGINIDRDIKRKHEMSYYVMVPSTESGFVSHFADLTGLNGIKPKQRFEFLPYILQKAQFLRHEADDPFYKKNQYKTSLGGDFKFSLSSNINLDVTINPDFGQVEVDPAIVNLSAFETFYDEKRPFFIEGSNVFLFGYGGSNNNWGFNFSNPELFYSRRIGRPPQGNVNQDGFTDIPTETRILGAGKLTGKIDESWSIGVLSAFTERMYADIQSEETGEKFSKEIEPFTHYGVFRSQKEFNGGKQAIGVIFTSVNRDIRTPNLSDLLSKNAYTIGTDGWTYLDEDETYVVTGSIIGSYVHGSENALVRIQKQPYRYFQRPDKTYMPLDSSRTSLSGVFSRFMLNKQKGNFYINAALGAISPGFEYNDLGSQWFADRINGHLVLGYRWYEPDNIFRRKYFYLAYNRTSDFEDNVSRSGFYSSNSVEFLNFWEAAMSLNYTFKTISTTLTRGGPKVAIPPNYSINISVNTDSRNKIIFEPYSGYWGNTSGSNEYYFGLELEWKPNSQISFSAGPEYDYTHEIYQWVDNIDDPFATETYNVRYVFGELTQNSISANIRLNWIFNPKLSLQIYLQPLFVVGDYNNFKELSKPNSEEYNIYGENGSTIMYNEQEREYEVDPDGNGSALPFSFSNPDFNFKSLRGNIVLRWEVFPGSVFYFVWTHKKDNTDNPGDFNFRRDFGNLWKSEADNILLAKFSYWFDI